MRSNFDIKGRVRASAKSIILVALVLSLAGCSSMISLDDTSSNGDSTTPQCELTHEVVDPSDDYVEATETYAYENLSSDAQRVFEGALANGSYSTTNQSLNPPEFRYWDTTTSYNITYQNETYKLLTYTGEGCENQ